MDAKTRRNRNRGMLAVGLICAAATCMAESLSSREKTPETSPAKATDRPQASPAVLRSEETEAAMRYRFSDADAAVLEEVQHACFLYFWKEVGDPSGLAKDRLKAPVSSIAAVGFQLSSLPIGVEHGWITREQGAERARTVLETLLSRQDNKHRGIYLHFPALDTGGLSRSGYEIVASTVDTALFIAGAIPAAEYFGEPVQSLVDRLIAEADWSAFATGPDGVLSMGWKPKDPEDMAGKGEFLPWHWHIASDEERIIYLLAVGSPDPDHAVDPQVYYRLKRVIKGHKDMPPFAVSWPGTLFTYFFSHCWIDFRSLGADDPSRLGVDNVPVDWLENSRRAVLTHRRRCIEQTDRFRTLSEDRWGLSACVGKNGYIVPEIEPNMVGKDSWHEGTVAPYAAASAIMFAPREAMAAIRAFRTLKADDGSPLIWRDPAKGGYGLADAFNLDQDYVSDDYVGIDHGPMLLAIENARTGLIWRLFMTNKTVKTAVARLKLAG